MDCLQRAQETSPDLVRETRVAAASVWDSLAEAADLRADVDKMARWVDGGCASQEAETELDVARRHIRDGEARIAKQEAPH